MKFETSVALSALNSLSAIAPEIVGQAMQDQLSLIDQLHLAVITSSTAMSEDELRSDINRIVGLVKHQLAVERGEA